MILNFSSYFWKYHCILLRHWLLLWWFSMGLFPVVNVSQWSTQGSPSRQLFLMAVWDLSSSTCAEFMPDLHTGTSRTATAQGPCLWYSVKPMLGGRRKTADFLMENITAGTRFWQCKEPPTCIIPCQWELASLHHCKPL